MSKKTLLHYAAPAIITGMLFATAAVSWDEPGNNPPAGNVAAPINVSADGQSKEGWLTVGSTLAPSMQLDVQGIAPLLGSLNVTGGAILNTGGAADGLIVENGRVGIGTNNPLSQLQLEGDSGNAAEILLKHTGVDGSAGIGFDVTNDAHSFFIKAHNNKLKFVTNDGGASYPARMVVMSDGRVGIGETNPATKLDVNGTIKGVNYQSGDGSQGLTNNITVKGSDGNDCVLTFKDGLLTAETCP
ncbi:MAG: hypothetical protein KAQ87_00645 [Candidatus Pacebacteria bacterium]|nr:hypothetical protein [Candidatus Paceibacterota bacterium]